MSTLRTTNVIHGSSAISNIVLDNQGRAIFGPNSPAGRAALYVNAQTNRVGVNTETPSVALDVDGAINATGNAAFNGNFSIAGSSTFTGLVEVGNDIRTIGWNGTTALGFRLDSGGALLLNQPGDGASLSIRKNGTENASISGQGNGVFQGSMKIGSAGGIGAFIRLAVGPGNNTNSEVAKINTENLNLNALTLSNWTGSTATNWVRIAFDNSGVGSWYAGGAAGVNSFVLWQDSTERVHVDSLGRIGIGNTDPDSRLCIASDNPEEFRIRQNSVGTAVFGHSNGNTFISGESGIAANRNIILGSQDSPGSALTTRVSINQYGVLVANTPLETQALYYLPGGKIHVTLPSESGIDNWVDMSGQYQAAIGTGSYIRFAPTFQNVLGQTGVYIGGISTTVQNTDLVWGRTSAGATTSTRSTKTEYGRVNNLNGNFQIFNQTTSPVNSQVTSPNFKLGAYGWDTNNGSTPYFLEIGPTAQYSASWGYSRANLEFTIQSARSSVRYNFMVASWNGNVNFPQAISKGSGSFKIKHPLPEKKETQYLVHSFIEGPQADLIYRGYVKLENGKAVVNIDEAARMSEGTFVLLCGNVSCFTSNESDWTPVKGSVSENKLTIEAQDPTSNATVSWMVVGERIDEHMLETTWTDENGRVITEPITEEEEIRIANLKNT